MVIARRFKKPALRSNRAISRSLPPRLPNGQTGTRMRVSEGERRLIQRRRQQSAGIRRVAVKGSRLRRTRV